MEDQELEQRIRAMQRIYGAEGMPEPGTLPLPGAQILALVQYMTPEEVLEELKRVCATLDKTILDNIVRDKMILQQHENQQKQEERHAREIAEKDAVIKSNEEKIRTLESELRDKKHSEETLKEEKFAGKSKRGIDKTKTTSKGRDDNKDDFDGTPDSAVQIDTETDKDDYFEDTKPVSRDRIQKIKKERASKYTLADASKIEDYYCDMSQLPEGAIVIDEDQDLTDVIFDEVRTIIARRYHYVI